AFAQLLHTAGTNTDVGGVAPVIVVGQDFHMISNAIGDSLKGRSICWSDRIGTYSICVPPHTQMPALNPTWLLCVELSLEQSVVMSHFVTIPAARRLRYAKQERTSDQPFEDTP